MRQKMDYDPRICSRCQGLEMVPEGDDWVECPQCTGSGMRKQRRLHRVKEIKSED